MLLPQNEAKFKNCPFLTSPDGKFRFCQGNQCMMWRFQHPSEHSGTDNGYCGLAGKPAKAM